MIRERVFKQSTKFTHELEADRRWHGIIRWEIF